MECRRGISYYDRWVGNTPYLPHQLRKEENWKKKRNKRLLKLLNTKINLSQDPLKHHCIIVMHHHSIIAVHRRCRSRLRRANFDEAKTLVLGPGYARPFLVVTYRVTSSKIRGAAQSCEPSLTKFDLPGFGWRISHNRGKSPLNDLLSALPPRSQS